MFVPPIISNPYVPLSRNISQTQFSKYFEEIINYKFITYHFVAPCYWSVEAVVVVAVFDAVVVVVANVGWT